VDAAGLVCVDEQLEPFVGEVFSPLGRKDRRTTAGLYVRGLMLDGRRKSMQPMAQRLRVDHQRLQQFVTSSPWDLEPVRKTLSRKACTLIEPDAWVIDDTEHHRPKWQMALEMIDELIEWGRTPLVVTADAGYGDTTAFRQGPTDRQIGYVVAVKSVTSAYRSDATPETAPYAGRGRPPIPRYRDPRQSCRDLAVAAGRAVLKTVTWRHGTKTDPDNPAAAMRSRFLALRIRPANRDNTPADDGSLPEAWLLAEWPTGADEPTDYWISTLSPDTPLKELVHLAKIRWRSEHDYRERKPAWAWTTSRDAPGPAGTTTPPSSAPPTCSSPPCG
jgi:SRSO17 transposase